jgi:hypothetical protein
MVRLAQLIYYVLFQATCFDLYTVHLQAFDRRVRKDDLYKGRNI